MLKQENLVRVAGSKSDTGLNILNLKILRISLNFSVKILRQIRITNFVLSRKI
jgi:hypothetical protein